MWYNSVHAASLRDSDALLYQVKSGTGSSSEIFSEENQIGSDAVIGESNVVLPRNQAETAQGLNAVAAQSALPISWPGQALQGMRKHSPHQHVIAAGPFVRITKSAIASDEMQTSGFEQFRPQYAGEVDAYHDNLPYGALPKTEADLDQEKDKQPPLQPLTLQSYSLDFASLNRGRGRDVPQHEHPSGYTRHDTQVTPSLDNESLLRPYAETTYLVGPEVSPGSSAVSVEHQHLSDEPPSGQNLDVPQRSGIGSANQPSVWRDDPASPVAHWRSTSEMGEGADRSLPNSTTRAPAVEPCGRPDVDLRPVWIESLVSQADESRSEVRLAADARSGEGHVMQFTRQTPSPPTEIDRDTDSEATTAAYTTRINDPAHSMSETFRLNHVSQEGSEQPISDQESINYRGKAPAHGAARSDVPTKAVESVVVGPNTNRAHQNVHGGQTSEKTVNSVRSPQEQPAPSPRINTSPAEPPPDQSVLPQDIAPGPSPTSDATHITLRHPLTHEPDTPATRSMPSPLLECSGPTSNNDELYQPVAQSDRHNVEGISESTRAAKTTHIARLELAPEDLGSVGVLVEVTDENLEARFTVSTWSAHTSLTREINTLSGLLQQYGLRPEYVAVDMSLPSEPRFGYQTEADARRERYQRERAAQPVSRGDILLARTLGDPSTIRRPQMQKRGERIDVFA